MRRKRSAERFTVEECLALDMALLKRDSLQENNPYGTYRWLGEEGEESFKAAITVSKRCSLVGLRYMLPGTALFQEPLNYFVETTATKCNLGGSRWWFHCPLVKRGIACKRRVRLLFLPLGARYFGCRACHDLTYESSQTHDSRVAPCSGFPTEILRFLARVDLRSRLPEAISVFRQFFSALSTVFLEKRGGYASLT